MMSMRIASLTITRICEDPFRNANRILGWRCVYQGYLIVIGARLIVLAIQQHIGSQMPTERRFSLPKIG